MFLRAVVAVGLSIVLATSGGCKPPPKATSQPAVASKPLPLIQPAIQQPTAQPPVQQPTQAGPHWVCEKPTLDYGEVWVGATVDRQFTFQNTGNAVLRLGKPQAACSCSSVPSYTQEVQPGGTGTIMYHLKTERKPNGPSNEHITFTTNDPVMPKVQIALTGFIKTALDPEVIYDGFCERDKAAGKQAMLPKKQGAAFGRVKADDTLHRVLKLRNTSGQPLSLTMQPLPADSKFRAELKQTIQGEEYELTVRLDPPIPVGYWSTPINFQTNVPQQPTYVVWAQAQVPERVEVIPPDRMVIDQSTIPQKERRITVTNNGTTPFDIVGVSTSEPAFGITLLARDPARPKDQVINIALPGGESYRPPPYGEIIEIKLSDPEVPVVKVRVLPSLTAQPAPRPPDKPLQMYPVSLPGPGK